VCIQAVVCSRLQRTSEIKIYDNLSRDRNMDDQQHRSKVLLYYAILYSTYLTVPGTGAYENRRHSTSKLDCLNRDAYIETLCPCAMFPILFESGKQREVEV